MENTTNVEKEIEQKGISLEEFRNLLREDKEETVERLNKYLSTLSNSTSKDFENDNTEYDFSYASLSKCMVEAGYKYTKKAFEKIPEEQKEVIVIEKQIEETDNDLDELAEAIVKSSKKKMVQTTIMIEESTKEKLAKIAENSSLKEAEIIRRLLNINIDKLYNRVEQLKKNNDSE